MKSQVKKIDENIELAKHTTFKIGGPARFFCEVRNESELEEAIKFAHDRKIGAFIMGGGSNILFSDDGFDGLVVKLIGNSVNGKPTVKMRMEGGDTFIECWAGESLASIVKLAADSSLSGLEWAVGIPGTIGGAVRGNAGAFGVCMGDNVGEVKYLDLSDNSKRKTQIAKLKSQNNNLKLKTLANAECRFAYRGSLFKENSNLVLISVVFRLSKGDKTEIENKMQDVLDKRKEKQPQGTFSAGSFFENPVVKNKQLIDRFEKDTGLKCKESKLPAGWLITEAGLLGKKIGNIQISERHGNFMVNLGGGKASDVIMLASLVKQKIREEFGVQLKEEVEYVGF